MGVCLEHIVIPALSAMTAAICAWWVSVHGTRYGLARDPDGRAMHVGRIARGGGIGIVLAGTGAGLWLTAGTAWNLTVVVFLAFLLGSAGLADDALGLRRRLRLVVQVAVCLMMLLALGPIPAPLEWIEIPELLLLAIALLGAVWWVNLYNFMDGIDGLAATEAVFLLAAGALVSVANGADWSSIEVRWTSAIVAACLGFLFYNWPKARVFMGDTSSLYLPLVVMSVALLTIKLGTLTYPFWLILVGAFVADTTVTLLTRMATGQKWTDPHHSHAYQKLARLRQSHLTALLTYIAVNLFYLLPLALAALAWPEVAWPLVVIAYLPLIVFSLVMAAGRAETGHPVIAATETQLLRDGPGGAPSAKAGRGQPEG